MNTRNFRIVLSVAAGALAFLSAGSLLAAEGESTAVRVDFTEAKSAVLFAPSAVAYDPAWEGGDAVSVCKVVNVGMESEKESELVSSSEEGALAVSPAEGDGGAFRLVCRVTKGGTAVAEYVRDVAFASQSAPSAAIVYDSRPGSVAEVVKGRPASLPLAYGTDWVSGSVSCRIDVSTHPKHAAEPVTVETLATLSGEGVYDWSGYLSEAGLRTLSLTMLDANGQAIGDPFLADEFKAPGGLLLLLR